MHRLVPLLVLLIAGCPSEEAEPTPSGPLVYEEDDDDGNHRRTFAEPIDDEWPSGLVIEGSSSGCGAEPNGGEWDYSEDRDYYVFEVFADGWLEITLDWEGDADLDMVVRTNGEGRRMLDDTDDQPVEYVREDVHARGDDINLGVFCKAGSPTRYAVTVELELD